MSVAKSDSSGEHEHHIVGVRARVVGQGSMRYSLEDYSAVQTSNLVPLTLAAVTRFEPTVLVQFSIPKN
jgi:hypothetical protein